MEVKNDDKRWIIKEHGDQLLVRRLSKDLGIDSVLANLLVQRGITTAMEAKEFFHPDLSKLNDPFLMEQMHIAVERLHAAAEDGGIGRHVLHLAAGVAERLDELLRAARGEELYAVFVQFCQKRFEAVLVGTRD